MGEYLADFGEDSMLGKLLKAAGPFGFIAIDESAVNMGDLLGGAGRHGAIVRCTKNPNECISVFSVGDDSLLGCVASWISEE